MNPFAFRPLQVSFWTTVIYLALVIPLLVINEGVPPAPADPTALDGLNITEAWLDLVTLTNGYHPYNSHKNDEVRNWLLLRIQDILDQNNVSWNTEASISTPLPDYTTLHASLSSTDRASSVASSLEDLPKTRSPSDLHFTSKHDVTVFNDLLSNVTCLYGGVTATASASKANGIATYFEGTNIIVYIRGTLDEDGEWWKSVNADSSKPIGQGGVLVNAHYDSVSTGYGATDDGVGVVTVLQLIKYFTAPGNQPKHGIVALLNNAEEDYLYGARAFGKSPLAPFVHTFLNLEGAGAGGRAILFRTTDQEVTAAYSKAKDPFGTVIGSDAFGLGFIRSQTDYVVFNGAYGARGMDIAFYRPRARYHTNQDDARHTSRASLWHMLSASVTTVENLSGNLGNRFIGQRGDGDESKVPNGKSSHGVWFDLFGKGFVLFNLRGMFAWSLTMLIATPLILILLTYFLHKNGKYYFFSGRVNASEPQDSDADEVEKIKIGGWKGFVRFPFAFVVATALVFGAAFLLRKINPLIVYSSEYAVWAMMISLFYFVFWSIMKGADFARPSALHRGYVHIWLFILSWALLVAVTVFTDRFKIASGYFFVFFQSAVFLSTIITFAELFALPNMRNYGIQVQEEDQVRDNLQAVPNADALIAPSPGEVDPATTRDRDDDEEAEPASETTPLVGGRANGDNVRTTFATTYRRSIAALTDVTRKNQNDDTPQPYDDEQPWSGNLPTWTWLLQLLFLGPFTVILATQLGLVLLDAVNQTGPDGSNLLLPFLVTGIFSILLLLPITPFIHRVTHHVPLFLLCVFVGTLIYNLVAFPFSADSRYKAYWQQLVNLDTGESTIKFSGIEEYIRPIIAELPSAAGKTVTCSTSANRIGVKECFYDGSDVPPNLTGDVIPGVPPQKSYGDLVSVNISHGSAPGTASFDVTAKNTKACYLRFKKPVKAFSVNGGTDWDDRFGSFPEGGISEILLWRRDWNKTWSVDIEWDIDAEVVDQDIEIEGNDEYVGPDELKVRAPGLEGVVSCLWSDINTRGTIPALDETLKFAPTWVAISKASAGLVEGSKSFIV